MGYIPYKERERSRAKNIAAELEIRGIENEPSEILSVPEANLYKKYRKGILTYFADNGISWWRAERGESKDEDGATKDAAKKKMPTGHMLSSQVCCLNHLFFLRYDASAALDVLQVIDSRFTEACPDFEGAYIGFEVISKGSYLNEGEKLTRGANCTSIDAMMSGKLSDGRKIIVFIEWKYTEKYGNECLADEPGSGEVRLKRYTDLIQDINSPFKQTVVVRDLFYEPFYQMMRQTLLAWQMVKHGVDELNANDWIHIDVVPENNIALRYKITSPGLRQHATNVCDAWKSQLKEPEKYRMLTPQYLLHRLLWSEKHYRGLMQYLEKRYW
ncbi:MAG: hypothetical protein LWX56_09285 [Ignavibacteria bacterium]|nr:hypothetical protein [Ignavibacteria bacterium]